MNLRFKSWSRGGSTADEVGAAAPPFETDFMLLSSDFSPKYCIFIVTAPPFCLTAPPFKNSWIRHCLGEVCLFLLVDRLCKLNSPMDWSLDYSMAITYLNLWTNGSRHDTIFVLDVRFSTFLWKCSPKILFSYFNAIGRTY